MEKHGPQKCVWMRILHVPNAQNPKRKFDSTLKAYIYGSSSYLYGTQFFYFYPMWNLILHLYYNNIVYIADAIPYITSKPLTEPSFL